MFVKPADGVMVRDPAHYRPLPVEGAEVSESTYWMRRLRDGDVVQAEAAPEPAADPADEPAADDSATSKSEG